MPSLAFRKASICSRFSFSASCTLVVNPQHATRSRLILCWKLPPPSGSSCIGKDCGLHFVDPEGVVLLVVIAVELDSSIQLRCPHVEGIEATIDKRENVVNAHTNAATRSAPLTT